MSDFWDTGYGKKMRNTINKFVRFVFSFLRKILVASVTNIQKGNLKLQLFDLYSDIQDQHDVAAQQPDII